MGLGCGQGVALALPVAHGDRVLAYLGLRGGKPIGGLVISPVLRAIGRPQGIGVGGQCRAGGGDVRQARAGRDQRRVGARIGGGQLLATGP